jgi:hypothetical protein
MKFYIPPQITRLAIAFAVFISLFLLVRRILVPDTFGEYGFYRGASLIDNADKPVHYAGQQACFDCHQDVEDLKLQDVHSEIKCETCHGPGYNHAREGDASEILKPSSREFCGSCHAKNAAKQSDAIFQVDLKEHNTGKKCIECHNPHQPWNMEN